MKPWYEYITKYGRTVLEHLLKVLQGIHNFLSKPLTKHDVVFLAYIGGGLLGVVGLILLVNYLRHLYREDVQRRIDAALLPLNTKLGELLGHYNVLSQRVDKLGTDISNTETAIATLHNSIEDTNKRVLESFAACDENYAKLPVDLGLKLVKLRQFVNSLNNELGCEHEIMEIRTAFLLKEVNKLKRKNAKGTRRNTTKVPREKRG